MSLTPLACFSAKPSATVPTNHLAIVGSVNRGFDVSTSLRPCALSYKPDIATLFICVIGISDIMPNPLNTFEPLNPGFD